MNRVTLSEGSAIALPCRIEPNDVDAMLDAYDSGMSDASTANCVSRAVSRMLLSERPLPLYRYDENTAALGFGARRVPIPSDLLKWLASAETGGQSGPLEFVLDVPAELLAAPERPATRRFTRPRPPRDFEPGQPVAV